jgi:hypothetical protein
MTIKSRALAALSCPLVVKVGMLANASLASLAEQILQ